MTTMPSPVAVSPGSGGFSSTRTGSTGTFAPNGGVFQTNDLLIWGSKVESQAATITPPAGWFSPYGGNNLLVASTHAIAVLLHWVTSAEVAAATKAWSLANVWDAAQTGRRVSAALRGVNPAQPVGAFDSQIDPANASVSVGWGTISPQATNSLLYYFGSADDSTSTSRTLSALPSGQGWVDLGSTYSTGAVTPMMVHGYQSAPNTAGVPVSGPAPMSLNGNDGWIGGLLEFLPIPDSDDAGDFFALL